MRPSPRSWHRLCAILAMTAFCAGFLGAESLAFLAGWQLIPALAAGAVGVVAVQLILALLFGRLYCSVFCPLGILQDGMRGLRPDAPFHHAPPSPIIRAAVFAVFLALLALGAPSVAGLLDPWSAFGRMAESLLKPAMEGGNAMMSVLVWHPGLEDAGSIPSFHSGPALTLSLLTLGVLAILTWRNGRTWCNVICPAGAILGLVSRFSLWGIRLDASRCVRCRKCEGACKAACMDMRNGEIDRSRCVSCFNCLDACPHGALSWGRMSAHGSGSDAPETARASGADAGRRALLGLALGGAWLVGDARPAAARDPEREIPALTRRSRTIRNAAITPPGSRSRADFTAHCIGCQLCVASCPSHVLASFENGLGVAQPSMTFEHGWCRSGCSRCSSVCPAGAILPVTAGEKRRIRLGTALVHPAACIVAADGVDCDACARICPERAITPKKGEHRAPPVVDAERCIGCGACEYVCPARPIAAIHVESLETHSPIPPERAPSGNPAT